MAGRVLPAVLFQGPCINKVSYRVMQGRLVNNNSFLLRKGSLKTNPKRNPNPKETLTREFERLLGPNPNPNPNCEHYGIG